MTQPTRTVTVLSAGFSDGSTSTLVLECGDFWDIRENGDVSIEIAAKPERAYIDDRKHTIRVAAQPTRHLIWRSRHLLYLEWNQAQVAEHQAYVPPSAEAR